jgi:hypothetical protein
MVERAIRVVKERIRCVLIELPWKFPRALTKWLVYYCVTRINSLGRVASGVAMSPREQFKGIKLDYRKDLSISFGDYVQAYRAPKVKNSMTERTVGAIALCPMDNQTKSWIFFNIISMKTFAASYWKLLPTPDIVIDRMTKIASGFSEIVRNDDEPPPLIDLRDLPVEDEPITSDIEPIRDVSPREYNTDNNSNIIYDDDDLLLTSNNIGTSDNITASEEIIVENSSNGLRRSARLQANVMIVSGNMSVAKALRTHGTVAEEAVKAELSQMLSKNVFEMVLPADVKNNHVIHSHMFLKEKRDQNGNLLKVKARLVAGGNEMDKSVYTEEKRTSPTVHTESIFMLLAWAAQNGMTVASIDIEGAFLESNLDIPVYMRLGKEVSSILVSMQPELKNYMNANGCIIVLLLKALYGLVVASQLWYKSLSNALLSFGLKESYVDKCVFYGKIDGHEIILCIHVDDIGIIKKNNIVVKLLETKLNEVFTKANVDMSNPLNFLGMNITIYLDAIYVDMYRYTIEACESWGATSGISTPGDNNLFKDDESSTPLEGGKAKTYHTGAAKLLFLSKRARPDILTPVSVCCGHVNAPKEQDWHRLDRVMKYLYGRPNYGLKFARGDNMNIKCYCDAAFACHGEYRSRTGIIVMVNGGVVVTKSSKQTLTTRSTPESELVALSDGAAIAMGCKNFYNSIDIVLPTINILEDNRTALEYIAAGGPIHARTRYIGVKYYFAKQYIDSGDLSVQYCKTTDMLADLMTKPVMGSLFESLRDRIVHEVPKVV